MNRRTLSLGVAVILLIRLFGIWHGYPYSFYPDEAHFVKRALSFGSFDFNPHWFHKPALFMYLLFFNYGLLFIFGKIASLWSSSSDFAVFYILNPGPFYMVGRVVTALFGVATIYLTYLIGERFFRKNVGLIAALLLTLCYGHLSAAQDIKADVPAAFFSTLSLLFLLNHIKEFSNKHLLLAALFSGMGAATKVYPMLMMPAILLSLFPLVKSSGTRRGVVSAINLALVSIAVFWGAYFLCSPYSFLDPLGRESVFANFVTLWEKISTLFASGGVTEKPAWVESEPISFLQSGLSYLRVLAGSKGLGLPIASICFAGFASLALKWERKNLLFLLFPTLLALFSSYTAPGYAEPRHQVPLYPFLAISGGVLIVELSRVAGSGGKKFLFGTLAVVLLWPLFIIIESGLFRGRPDTRNTAKEWIEKNIPAGTKILANENGPVLLSSEASLEESIKKANRADSSGQFTAHYGKYLEYQLEAAKRAITYDITEIRHPWWRDSEPEEGVSELTSAYDRDMGNHLRPVGVNTYEYYVENGYRYAVVHSGEYLRYLKPGGEKRVKFPSFVKFYSELFSRGKLIKEFLSEREGFPGPVVKIYQF